MLPQMHSSPNIRLEGHFISGSFHQEICRFRKYKRTAHIIWPWYSSSMWRQLPNSPSFNLENTYLRVSSYILKNTGSIVVLDYSSSLFIINFVLLYFFHFVDVVIGRLILMNLLDSIVLYTSVIFGLLITYFFSCIVLYNFFFLLCKPV